MQECNLQGEMVITINRYEDLDKISNMKLDLQLLEKRRKNQCNENNLFIPAPSVPSVILNDAARPAIPANVMPANTTPPETPPAALPVTPHAAPQATPMSAKATPPSAAIKISSINAKAIAKSF
jgi:hypothetical protein